MLPDESSAPRVFVVIAAYNESAAIRRVTDQVVARYPYTVVVDDGSTDNTSAHLVGSNVFLLRHMINRGQGAALQTGIQFSLLHGADIIVTFDADGQHDVGDISALVEPILRGECDVTFGSRFLGHAHNIPFSREITLKAGVLFTRLVSRVSVTDIHNGLRAFSRQAASSLRIRMDRMAHASEVLDQVKVAGWRYREVRVNIYYSDESLRKGQSSWSALKIASQLLLKRILG
jgi:polyprenyl-phospho-N-acetylgalactosaminyl synthase